MIDNNRFFVTILRKKKKKDFEIFLISAFQKYIFLYVRVCLDFGKIEKTLCIFCSMYMIAENWKEHGLLN